MKGFLGQPGRFSREHDEHHRTRGGVDRTQYLGLRPAEGHDRLHTHQALEQSAGNFVSVRIINPGRTVTINYVVAYERGSMPPSPLLDHIRGLYRMRLRFSYTSNGTDPLPVEDSYSQPFAVSE